MTYWIKKYFSDPEAHIAALYEVIITALFSLAPFFITYFVESAKRKDGTFMPLESLVGRGQIYLLAYAIYGTIFWLAFMKSDRIRHGARAFLGGVATLTVLPIVGFIGVDPTFSTILNGRVVIWGFRLYAALLMINYLLLFYMNITPPEPTEVLDREADDMRKRYEGLKNNA